LQIQYLEMYSSGYFHLVLCG